MKNIETPLSSHEINKYTAGDCVELAAVISVMTGHQVRMLQNPADECDYHAVVEMPDGTFLDARGRSSQDDLLKKWKSHEMLGRMSSSEVKKQYPYFAACAMNCVDAARRLIDHFEVKRSITRTTGGHSMRFNIRTHKSVENEDNSGDCYRGDSQTTWDFDDGYISDRNTHGDDLWIEIDASLAEAKRLFPVVAIWTQHDSFGVDLDASAEIMSVHPTRESAELSAKILREAKSDLQMSIRSWGQQERGIPLPDGYSAPTLLPWHEGPVYIQVMAVEIGPEPSDTPSL